MNPATSQPDALERSTMRRVAWRLLPFLIICYLIAIIDRGNIGMASLQMNADLNLTAKVFGFASSLFFFAYFLVEVPSNLAMQRYGARIWIARIMITWGIISALFAFVETAWQFYALRFLLGIAEAGLAPGLLLYLTYWFPSYRRARMTVLWFVAIPLSGMIGGPLSGWIMNHFAGVHGWSGWQWMFVIEAVPTVIVGLLVLTYLKDGVHQATWLSDDEKALINKELAEDNSRKVTHTSAREFLRDRRLWLLAGIYFCVVMGQYAITFWLPTLVRNAGVSDPLHIGLMTSLPYLCAIVAMLLMGHLVCPMIAGAIGLTLAALMGGNLLLSVLSLCLAAAGVLSASSLFWMLPTTLLGGVSAAAGIAGINSFANLAGFCSPYLIGWITTLTGSSAIGMYLITAVLLFGATLVLRIPAAQVNR